MLRTDWSVSLASSHLYRKRRRLRQRYSPRLICLTILSRHLWQTTSTGPIGQAKGSLFSMTPYLIRVNRSKSSSKTEASLILFHREASKRLLNPRTCLPSRSRIVARSTTGWSLKSRRKPARRDVPIGECKLSLKSSSRLNPLRLRLTRLRSKSRIMSSWARIKQVSTELSINWTENLK